MTGPDIQKHLELLNSGEEQIGDYMVEGFEAFQTSVENGWYGDGVDGDAADALRAGEKDISDFTSGMTAFYFGPLNISLWWKRQIPARLSCIREFLFREERHC